ncbi:MAG TPA: type II CAAX endopeptidase family protein [Defluviitaleaceae bacterium]|nr:type II CAAX endopeptidase family protein [Defluviitaleaceae bacterium]HPT77421.1 type II CAAX endopeptidase family protein [Defluviitaleaceae bacterium]
MKRKFKDLGIAILYTLTALGMQLLTTLAVTLLGGFLIGYNYTINNPEESLSEELIVEFVNNFVTEVTPYILIIASLSAFVIYLLVIKLYNKSFIKYTNFTKPKMSLLALSAIIGIALNLAVGLIISLTGAETYFPEHEEVINSIVGELAIQNIIVTAITAPLFEEILFRGLIFRQVKKSFPVAAAVIIQSILFALLHGNTLQMLYTFILGVSAALVCQWGDSLWNAIVLHIFYNGTSLILTIINMDFTLLTALITMTISSVIYIAGMIICYKKRCDIQTAFVNNYIASI